MTCIKVQIYVDCSFTYPNSLDMNPSIPPASALSCPQSVSSVESTIFRNRHRSATRVARNRAALRAVPTMVHGVLSFIKFNMRFQHRARSRSNSCEPSLTTFTRFCASSLGGACVRPEDVYSQSWSWRNAVEDILRHSAYIGVSDDNKKR